MHPDEHLRTQTAKTTENCVKGCVDSSQIVALKEDLNFLHRRKISNFSNFYYPINSNISRTRLVFAFD